MVDLRAIKKFSTTNELSKMAAAFGTDKSESGYTQVYHEIMKEKRESITASLLEIGIFRGSSIKMWHQYFKYAKIFGIDNGRLLPNTNVSVGRSNQNPSSDDTALLNGSICKNTEFDWIENERIKCAIADQRSYEQLKIAFLHFKCSDFDFIIDDGHHFQEHQQKTIGVLFPHVKSGGFYAIEDICCLDDLINGSYWGQKEKDCSDSTDRVFSNFLSTGTLMSPYMTEEQISYIQDHTEDIFLYDSKGKNDSPVVGPAKLLILKKK